ncbi:unnamed protein product [Boreogadus saida]
MRWLESLCTYIRGLRLRPEETVYETIGPAPSAPPYMEDVRTHSLVVRVLVPDLQQTAVIHKASSTQWNQFDHMIGRY